MFTNISYNEDRQCSQIEDFGQLFWSLLITNFLNVISMENLIKVQ